MAGITHCSATIFVSERNLNTLSDAILSKFRYLYTSKAKKAALAVRKSVNTYFNLCVLTVATLSQNLKNSAVADFYH